jgi:hypothetical protein
MIFRNHEHYADPTAGEAIRNVMLEQAGIRGKNGEYRKIMEKEYNILCGWGEMTESLVLLAAEDYRKALKKLQKNPDNIKARETKEEIEDFFRHGWFREAYHIEPDYMIRKLKEESGWTE